MDREAHEHAPEPELKQQQQPQDQINASPPKPLEQPLPITQQQPVASAPTDDTAAVTAFLSAIRAKLKDPLPNWFIDLSKAMTQPASYPSKEQRLATKHVFPSRLHDPIVQNQPASCPQRAGRDYEKEPILMIMPTGTGGIESMPCAVKCTYWPYPQYTNRSFVLF